MKRFIVLILGFLIFCSPAYAVKESGSNDAQSVVLYGKTAAGALVPVKVAADGTVGGGSGGWTDAGTTISQTTLTDKIGIGTATPLDFLTILGSASTNVYSSVSLAGTSSTATTKGVQFGNGSWYTTGVPFVQPIHTGDEGIFDVLPKAATTRSWVDICSDDVTADASNWECVEVRKEPTYASVSAKASGTGTKRNLILQNPASPTLATGFVGVHTTQQPQTNLVVSEVRNGANGGAGFALIADSTGAAVASGDRLGIMLFGGDADATATSLVYGAGIYALGKGTFSASNAPTDLIFETAPSGSATRVTALTITSAGSVVMAKASAQAGQATCWTTNGQIGYCTSVVGAGGACTCTGL